MSKLESHASKKEEHSLISKELRKGFDDFSDELKADALSKTFVSDEIAKLEKLEDKLKKKKEVLESRIHDKKTYFWIINFWLLVMLMMSIIFLSVGHYFRPKDQPTAGIWIRPAFKVAVVIFFFLLGFEVFEEIMDKIGALVYKCDQMCPNQLYVVGNLATLIIMICTAIEVFFYNTDPRKTYIVITQLVGIIILPVACYGVIQNQIAEENAI